MILGRQKSTRLKDEGNPTSEDEQRLNPGKKEIACSEAEIREQMTTRQGNEVERQERHG
jgi:hypothetical protein